jgi:hypothetical protein
VPQARALYTVEEFTRDICPMSKATFYTQVNSGRLETVTIGRRRYVPADSVTRFVNALAAEAGA